MIDAFGTKPEFMYHGEEKQRTNCGVLLTWMFIAFAIWNISFLSQELIDLNSPITNQVEKFFEDPEPMIISPETFYLAFGLQHPTNFAHYIDPTIFNVTAKYQVQTRTPTADGDVKLNFADYPLELVKCNSSFFGDVSESVKNLELPFLFCINPQQSTIPTLEIRGRFESALYKYITVDFAPCKNGTSVICKPQNQIDTLLNGAYFAAYYSDTSLDLTQYKNPKLRYLDSSFTTFGQSYYKEYTVYLRHMDVISNAGWFFDSFETKSYQRFDRIFEVSDFRDNDKFFRLVVRVSTMKSFYNRSYMKIPDLLANIDGTLTLVLVAIAILSFPYIKVKFYEELINEVFDVRQYREENETKEPDFDQNQKVLKKQLLKRSTMRNKTKRTLTPFDPRIINAAGSPKIEPINRLALATVQDRSSSPISPKKSIELKPVTNNRKKSSFDSPKIKIQEPKEERRTMSEVNKDYVKALNLPKVRYDNNMFRNKVNTSHLPEKTLDVTDSLINIDLSNNAQPEPESKQNSPRTEAHTNIELKFSPAPIDSSPKGKYLMPPEPEFKKDDAKIDGDHIVKMNLPENDNEENVEYKHDSAPRKKGMTISLIEYFRSFFSTDPKLKKKFALINDGKELINQRLDLFNILQKIRDIDKLKALLLDTEQLILFNSLPKPLLDPDSKQLLLGRISRSHATLAEREFIQKVNKESVRDAFAKINQKTNKSIVDLRLMAIYDEELIE